MSYLQDTNPFNRTSEEYAIHIMNIAADTYEETKKTAEYPEYYDFLTHVADVNDETAMGLESDKAVQMTINVVTMHKLLNNNVEIYDEDDWNWNIPFADLQTFYSDDELITAVRSKKKV